MPIVTNQAEYEAAVAANEVVITISGTVNTVTVPTHGCKIILPAGSALTGAIVNSCGPSGGTGEAFLYYGSLIPTGNPAN